MKKRNFSIDFEQTKKKERRERFEILDDKNERFYYKKEKNERENDKTLYLIERRYKDDLFHKQSFLDDSEFLAFELYNQIRINKQIENLKCQIAKDNSFSSILKCFNMIEKHDDAMNINNFEVFLQIFDVKPIYEELELLFNSLDKSKKGKIKY